MKWLCSADWHVRSSIPQHRLDAYPETILYKIEFMVNTANEEGAGMLVAGDLFHGTVIHPYHLNWLINILRECDHDIIAIPGQHDQSYHREDLIHSPYRTLEEAGVIEDASFTKIHGVAGYGWGTNINNYNFTDPHPIALVHHCITDGEPPFFLEESAISAARTIEIFENYSFIISGDYHIPHQLLTDSQVLINCGSIGRSNRDQLNHKPCCYLIDTEELGEATRIEIPIEPSEKIFSKAAHIIVEEDTSFTDSIKEISKLIKAGSGKLKFSHIVRKLAIESKATQRQKEIMKRILRGVRK